MKTERSNGIAALTKVRDAARSSARTLLYGNVVAYDATRRRATVQPGRMQRIEGRTVPMPQIPFAPVAWPCAAGITQEGRLDPGDPVLIAVSDRELSPWIEARTGPVPPRNSRRHSLADAIVLAGILRPASPGVANPSEYWIGKTNRTSGIAIQIDGPQVIVEAPPAGIRLGRAAVQPAVLGTALITALATFANAVNGMLATGTSVQNAAALEVIRTAAATLNTFLGSGLALSTKVRLE